MSTARIAVGAAVLALACMLAAPRPAAAQAPAQPPGAAAQGPAAPGRPADPFAQPVTLPERRIVYLNGVAKWDSAYATIVDALKSIDGYLAREGIKPAGHAMVIYTETDDTGFAYRAAVPIDTAPKRPPHGDIALGQAPGGKALKFVHRGSYDAMDTTYEAITNYLDEKRLEAQNIFIEDYVTDPLKTAADKLVVNIYVPLK